jgi:predicted Zn-dependent protease with MMP-like domain
MDLILYETIVRDALSTLPEKLRTPLQDVAIIVEDEPPPGHPGILLGLYEGVPFTAWGRDFNGKPPDKITLYRASIERVAHSPEEIPHLVRETLWHEIAHYFGYGHDHIRDMEARWRAARNSPAGQH